MHAEIERPMNRTVLSPLEQRVVEREAALKHQRAVADAERRRANALERDVRTMAQLAVVR